MFHFIKRHKLLSFFLLAIMVLAIVTALRWKKWFHNPDERPYSVSDKPQWVLLTPGNGGETTRNISWMCGDSVYDAFAEVVDTDDGDTMKIKAEGEVFESRADNAAYYVARLNSLKPDRHYAYRVVTNGKTSDWYEFRTYPEGRDRFSFMYIGDVQDTIHGKTNHFLKEALAHQPESEFLLCAGDLTERPTHQYWEETFAGIDSICQTIPFINITGNHDYLKGVICTLERRFSLIFSYFLDSMVDDNMVYTTTYGNAQLFLLDSNREFFYLFTQRDWLKEQLEKSTAKWKIVVIHHPLYSIRSNNLIQKWMFNDMIQEYGVDLVLQGHEHAYARRTMKDDNGYTTTPVYLISHCSPKSYAIYFDDEFDKYGISGKYYQTIDFKGDTMSIAAYDATNHELYDSLDIIKTADTLEISDFGKNIKENLTYKVNPSSSKSLDFMERIEEYKFKHPERVK